MIRARDLPSVACPLAEPQCVDHDDRPQRFEAFPLGFSYWRTFCQSSASRSSNWPAAGIRLHQELHFAFCLATRIKQTLGLAPRNESEGSIFGACQRCNAQRWKATLRSTEDAPLPAQRDVLLREQEPITR